MIELDSPGEVRKSEELNNLNLSFYLKNKLGSSKRPLVINQFKKGFSNLTYSIIWDKNEYVLRKPPFGANIKSGHDMRREYNVLSNLSKYYNKVPKTYFFEDDKNVIGSSFYVMQRLNGIILRPNTSESSMPDKKDISKLSKNFIKTLTELHGLQYKKMGLDNLGKGVGYGMRQIVGWSERYKNSKTDDIKEMNSLMSWLINNLPKQNKSSLIHNDYKYDNVVLDKDNISKIVGVLDWEMSTIGDPLFDLGTTLGYWVQSNDHPMLRKISLSSTTAEGNPSRMTLINIYEKYSKVKVNNPVFYYAYGLFKICVIVQQIYYRFKKGYTDDKRFSNLIDIVKICSLVARRSIEKNKIDDLF